MKFIRIPICLAVLLSFLLAPLNLTNAIVRFSQATPAAAII